MSPSKVPDLVNASMSDDLEDAISDFFRQYRADASQTAPATNLLEEQAPAEGSKKDGPIIILIADDSDDEFLPSPPITPENKKRCASQMIKDTENNTVSKVIKLCTPSKESHVIDRLLITKDDLDMASYNMQKAHQQARRYEQEFDSVAEDATNKLYQHLPDIRTEMARWEIMYKHELKATEQRVQELKEKMGNLKAFDIALDNFELNGVRGLVLYQFIEAVRPLP